MAFLSLVSAPGGWGWFRGSWGGAGRRGFWEHDAAGPTPQGILGQWGSSVLVSGDFGIVADLGPGHRGF